MIELSRIQLRRERSHCKHPVLSSSLRFLPIPLVLFVICASLPLLLAQNQTAAKVTVSAFPGKAKQGAPIEVTVTLENVGERSFYIPKWLRTSTPPAVPGFDIDLQRDGRSVCRSEIEGEINPPKKRKPVAILREDYFLLPPNFSLTYRETVGTCGREPLPVGIYQIQASYSGRLADRPDFGKIRTDFPVLQTVINAEPITIEITE